jgi:hypothetical protein
LRQDKIKEAENKMLMDEITQPFRENRTISVNSELIDIFNPVEGMPDLKWKDIKEDEPYVYELKSSVFPSLKYIVSVERSNLMKIVALRILAMRMDSDKPIIANEILLAVQETNLEIGTISRYDGIIVQNPEDKRFMFVIRNTIVVNFDKRAVTSLINLVTNVLDMLPDDDVIDKAKKEIISIHQNITNMINDIFELQYSFKKLGLKMRF